MRTLTKWSVADYQHMRELGILDRRRCELINGEIWDMAPEGEFHRFVNHRGVKYLRKVMKGMAEIFEAHPITLPESEPQPDIAVVRSPDTRYLKHHPYPEDIYWLVEVADTTLTYDLNTKRELYAKAGIEEYWVIHVASKQLTVFRDLYNGDFSTQTTADSGILYPVAFPNVAIDIRSLVSVPEEY
ncbi:Uma2 family endonuclease [Oscillatoria sp. CS-180]|uniref:Uma2 family endonuclease n=1 Tax=Oscillatoria sp. CS-180 TaxID=3021720 RepID=UPI002330EAB5|nr:Uma2 family endonuclease [Oscillatoria sp. CS-180]MDB9524897.1 Uma2 family endonuclease [Oscillatoria sp. CS-180]